MTGRLLSAALMVEVTGCTYRQLDHWTSHGHITATAKAPGTGSPRAWPESEARAAAAIRRLAALGLPLAEASAIAHDRGPGSHVEADGVVIVLRPGLWALVGEPADQAVAS